MKILIAEDDPTSRRILESILGKWGYDVVSACDGEEAWNIIKADHAPSLMVLDWMMPGLDGIELCRRIRERDRNHATYIILLTALDRKENIVTGLEAGADDYVIKPFDRNELQARINVGRRMVELQAELRNQATRDPLTGAYNRRYFREIIEREMKRSQRSGHSIGFLMIDVDRFKMINDTYGHQTGDRVLQHVANLLQKNIRASEMVVRYGGDEFLIFLLDVQAEIDVVKNRILKAFDEWNSKHDLFAFPVRLSIGGASWYPESSQTLEEILAQADHRMYRDKRNWCKENVSNEIP